MNNGLYSRLGCLLHFYVRNLHPLPSRWGDRQFGVKRDQSMNLHGSTTGIQNILAQLYLKLEQRFIENGLIREVWSGMAHDVMQQIASLKAFPSSFWNQLQKSQDGLLGANLKAIKLEITEKPEDMPLKRCFEVALLLEEPTILKIYVPIIRSLRKNWTNTALDFYIIVKAHLARIARVTESFSGDPLTIQRSHLLLQNFEKEVQEPYEIVKPVEKKKQVKPSSHAKKTAAKPKKAAKRAGPLAKRVKMHHARTKSLVNMVGLQQRRARR